MDKPEDKVRKWRDEIDAQQLAHDEVAFRKWREQRKLTEGNVRGDETMNEMAGARAGDVYVDKNGKLWRVIGVWSEPTVILEEIESKSFLKQREHGGVNGAMWNGFERIYRPENLDGIAVFSSSDYGPHT